MVLTADRLYEKLSEAPLATQGDRFALSFRAMGTDCQIQFGAPSSGRARQFQTQALRWLAEFEARYSRFLPDSLISRINAGAGGDWIPVDAETEGLFQLSDWYHWLTRGLFDPTTLPLLRLWDYHQQPFVPPTPEQIEDARARIGWRRVERQAGAVRLPEAGMALDLGGIGKEYAVDRVLEMARAAGLSDLLVDFGHDLRVSGEPPEKGPWRIGLEDPADPNRCWGGVGVNDRAVCSSGDYFRKVSYGGRVFGHILDPRTGQPVDNACRSVTVIAPTCTDAGILCTAAFILGPEEGLALIDAHHHAEGCLITEKTRYLSRRFHEYML
jgi:thiamine biosynthesis lipoprotein